MPFRPYVSNEADVGNFSEEFTAQPPMNSPGQPPAKHADLFRVSVRLDCLCWGKGHCVCTQARGVQMCCDNLQLLSA